MHYKVQNIFQKPWYTANQLTKSTPTSANIGRNFAEWLSMSVPSEYSYNLHVEYQNTDKL